MKGKIKNIKIYAGTNKDGSKSAGITFEDTLFGFYNFKDEIQWKIGDEVDYSYEELEKKDKTGKYKVLTLNKIEEEKPEKPPLEPTKRKEWHANSYNEMKYESRMDIIELITRLIIAGKIELKEAPEYYNDWVDMIDITIDELKG